MGEESDWRYTRMKAWASIEEWEYDGNGFEEKMALDLIGEEMKEAERNWRDFSPLLLITCSGELGNGIVGLGFWRVYSMKGENENVRNPSFGLEIVSYCPSQVLVWKNWPF